MTDRSAHTVLMDHLAAAHQGGDPVPCMAWPHGGWTSDDLAEQQLVVKLCRACPALTECRDYITTNPEPTGAWAGLTELDRRPRRTSRPRTEKSA